MHDFQKDPHTGLFIGKLSGPTTIADIARGVTICVGSENNRVAAVWELTDMQVSFNVAEIRNLITALARKDLPDGKMAFVTGPSAFSKSLVKIISAMRPRKRLVWQTFPTFSAAEAWAISSTP